MPRLRSFLVPVAVLVLVTAACGSTAPPAAMVGGDEIGQDDLDGYLADQDVAEPASRQDVARVLTEYIWVDLFENDLEQRGRPVPTDDEYRADLDAAQPEPEVLLPANKIGLLVRRIAEDESGLTVDSSIEDVAALVPADQLPICSSHVLVATEAEAQVVIERLGAGEELADLASEVSLDEGSAANGGSLGCVAPASFVPEFRDALVELDDGGVSGVVQTQFGFHVLMREGVGFEDTTAAVLFDAYAGELAIELLRTGDVDVLERLGEWNPESSPPQVVVRL